MHLLLNLILYKKEILTCLAMEKNYQRNKTLNQRLGQSWHVMDEQMAYHAGIKFYLIFFPT